MNTGTCTAEWFEPFGLNKIPSDWWEKASIKPYKTPKSESCIKACQYPS